jgi:hypothetical protein
MRGLFVLLLISGTALADDEALLRCRGIADAGKRLACYDALVVPAGEARAVQGQQNRAVQGESQQTPEQFGIDRQSQQNRAVQGESQPTPEQFGIERRAPKTELQAVESRIPGRFEGWEPRSKIQLANGQVWQIADDSSQYFYLDNPKATIRRGALGAFYLEIEGSNVTARVRRVQ